MSVRSDRQQAALAWAYRVFGDAASDPRERALRLVEEAIEFGQAMGMTWIDVASIANRVYQSPPGSPMHELGQVGFTFEICAEHLGVDADTAIAVEWRRVQNVSDAEWERRHGLKRQQGIAK